MCKAQEYENHTKNGMTVSEVARQYGASRQCVSQAPINYRKPKEENLGIDRVRYPWIKKWLQDNRCSFKDFEKLCGCCLRNGLMEGKGMRKFAIDSILKVTGLTYGKAFSQ